MLNLRIEPVDDDPGVTSSLYRWLRDDMAAGPDGEIALESVTGPGQMGAADVITAVLTQLTGVGSLAIAFSAWRGSRSRPPAVRFTLEGDSIELDADSAEVLTAALTALARKHRAPDAEEEPARPAAEPSPSPSPAAGAATESAP